MKLAMTCLKYQVLKSDTVKYYFDEKSNFLHTFLKLSCVKKNLSQAQNHFTFNSIMF
jgi:hypothetical protein